METEPTRHGRRADQPGRELLSEVNPPSADVTAGVLIDDGDRQPVQMRRRVDDRTEIQALRG
jgi:hypothetical protein